MPTTNATRSDPIAPNLEALRAEIDRIDDALLELVEQRLAASAAIAAGKDSRGDGRLKLRPRREAAVIKRLASRARLAPPGLVTHIWRSLMSYGLQAQTPTVFMLCSAGDRSALEALVRGHFGPAALIRWAAAPAEAITAAQTSETVAVIDLTLDYEQGEGLRVFDRLAGPDGQPCAAAIGRVAAEDAIVGAEAW